MYRSIRDWLRALYASRQAELVAALRDEASEWLEVSEAAAGMHGFAAGTYPFLKSVPPQQFVQGLATAEIVRP